MKFRIHSIKQLIQIRGKKQILLIVIMAFMGIVVGYTAAQILIPNFEIISPINNTLVNQTIIIGGHGAIPGKEIVITVTDDLGQPWKVGPSYSNSKGDWQIYPVYVGEPGNRQNGKKYVIYAAIASDSGEIHTDIISVIRK